MSIAHDSRYAYAVGRIRVLETRLLDMAKLNRMIEAKDAEEAWRILGETDYADAVARVGGAHDYAFVLTSELTRLYSLMKKLLPDESLVDLFLIKYDIHNMKTALKAQLGGHTDVQWFIDAGLVPAKLMSYVCQGEKLDGVPPEYYSFVSAATQAYEVSKDPRVIDLVLDRCQYSHTKAKAEQLGYTFMVRIVVGQIDLINIQSLVRTKRLGRGRDFLSEALLPGGTIAPSMLIDALTEDWASLAARFAATPYSRVLEQGINNLLESRSLTGLEKLCDEFGAKAVRALRFEAFGPEPIANYITAKENEVRNIRIIMSGKLNSVPNDDIRERLREGYA